MRSLVEPSLQSLSTLPMVADRFVRVCRTEVGERAVRSPLSGRDLGDAVAAAAAEEDVEPTFDYWRNIDNEIGDRIAEGVNGE